MYIRVYITRCCLAIVASFPWTNDMCGRDQRMREREREDAALCIRFNPQQQRMFEASFVFKKIEILKTALLRNELNYIVVGWYYRRIRLFVFFKYRIRGVRLAFRRKAPPDRLASHMVYSHKWKLYTARSGNSRSCYLHGRGNFVFRSFPPCRSVICIHHNT